MSPNRETFERQAISLLETSRRSDLVSGQASRGLRRRWFAPPLPKPPDDCLKALVTERLTPTVCAQAMDHVSGDPPALTCGVLRLWAILGPLLASSRHIFQIIRI